MGSIRSKSVIEIFSIRKEWAAESDSLNAELEISLRRVDLVKVSNRNLRLVSIRITRKLFRKFGVSLCNYAV